MNKDRGCIILLSLVSIVSFFSIGYALDEPTQVHINCKGDPSNSMTVLWKTGGTTQTSTVKWGTNPSNLNNTATGTQFPSPNQLSGTIHEVELTGLEPNTLYYYKCGDNLDGWSTVYSFVTAQTELHYEDFSFAAFGDTHYNNSNTLNLVNRLAQQLNPPFEFFVHCGDITYADGIQGRWDDFFNNWLTVMPNLPGFLIPGEHEDEYFIIDMGITTYLGRFALPNNEVFYSFDWGRVHFIMLYSDWENPAKPEEEDMQKIWLEMHLQEIAEDPTIKWKIIVLHRPLYSSGETYGSDLEWRDYLAPLCDQYGIDLVLSAHERNYERTYPLNNNEVVNTDPNHYIEPEGTIYVVTGGGGAGKDTSFENPPPSWSAFRQAEYHYLHINVYRYGRLEIIAKKSSDGTEIDSFTIDKLEPTPTPTPTETWEPTDTKTPMPTGTPTPSISATPTFTATPTKTAMPTWTPTITPSGGPQYTSTPTATATPLPSGPKVLVGGYWDTYLTATEGGNMRISALVTEPEMRAVELYYGGMATGILLYDDGQHGDFGFGDGLYGNQFTFAPGDYAPRYLFELQPSNRQGIFGPLWPYLPMYTGPTFTPTIAPATATPTATNTPTPSGLAELCKAYIDPDPMSNCDEIAYYNCSNPEVSCDFDAVAYIVTHYSAQLEDSYRFEWRKNMEVYEFYEGVVSEECDPQFFISELIIDTETRSYCNDDWRVEFYYNDELIHFMEFDITADTHDCRCLEPTPKAPEL